MKHREKIAPVAAALSALTTVICCLPIGLAAAAATASLGAVVSAYRLWFLAVSAVLLIVGVVQVAGAGRACSTRSHAATAIVAASAVVVVLVIFFPQLVAGLLADWLP